MNYLYILFKSFYVAFTNFRSFKLDDLSLRLRATTEPKAMREPKIVVGSGTGVDTALNAKLPMS
jgi:hypothetical protein